MQYMWWTLYAIAAALALPGVVCTIYFRDWRPLLWPAHMLIGIMLWILGWLVCVPAGYFKQWRLCVSTKWPDRGLLQWKHQWMYVWGNEEDGIDGSRGYLKWTDGVYQQAFWLTPTLAWSLRKRVILWSCWRNPFCNLRFIKPFGFLIDPRAVQWRGNSKEPEKQTIVAPRTLWWHYVQHGVYSGCWFAYRRFSFRIGWKIYPSDREAIAEDDYRRKGCGFALQLERK